MIEAETAVETVMTEPGGFVFPPTARTVLVDGKDGRLHVVTHQTGRFAWLMPLKPLAKEWPRPTSLKELNSKLDTGAHRYALHVPTERAPPVPKWQQDAGAERFKQLADVLGDPDRLKYAAGRSAAVTEIVAALGMAKSSSWAMLRRWLASGMLPAALMGDSRKPPKRAIDADASKKLDLKESIEVCRCAGLRIMETPAKPVERVDFNKRSGEPRQRRQGDLTRFKCDDHAVRVIWEAIHKVRGPAVTSKDLMNWLRENVFFSINPAGEKVAFPADAMPSVREVLNWRLKLLPRSHAIQRERGANWARKNAQAILGSQIDENAPAGGVGQIDATIWNINILADTPAREPIGPAVVFRLRAKDGGILLGIHAGLEAASWAEAACAIDNALNDKVELAAEYGLRIEHEDWPVIGLPTQIYADCGETYNSRPHPFIALTGVQIHNLPADSPQLKGGVEGDFFVLQTDLNGMTPAAIIKRYEDATKSKWVVKASMTMKEFMALLLLAELRRMKQPKQRVKLPERLAQVPGANTSSLGLWHALSSLNGTGLRDFSSMREDVRVSLLNRERTGSVTAYGLLFRGLHYVPVLAQHNERFVEVRDGSRRGKLEIAFDHRLVDTVYIVPKGAKTRSEYIEFRLNVAMFGQADLLGRRFREARVLLDRTKEENAQAAKAAEERDRELEKLQRRILASAQQKTDEARKAHPVPIRQLVDGIPEAREAEKNRFSPTTALVPAGTPPAEVQEPEVAPFIPGAPPDVAPPPGAPVDPAEQRPSPATPDDGTPPKPEAAAICAGSEANSPPAPLKPPPMEAPPALSVAASRLALLQQRAAQFNTPSEDHSAKDSA